MRIFWMGAHKVLMQTELKRLRELGYETFNPPYLSKIKDQSAVLEWDEHQPTTLPPQIFKKLSRCNFFYNKIPKAIADILNKYFDVVIVTISPLWLRDFVESFNGKIIYRTYGQHYLVSDEIAKYGISTKLIGNKNFHFLPFAKETLANEQSWLKDCATPVPYCLTDDVFEHVDQWTRSTNELALICPNIDNPYFEEHFKFLKKNFTEQEYKVFGVQISDQPDPMVVGTLSRDAQLDRFKSLAGLIYTHTEERVCYLPPIEMMVMGGPVLFLKGSFRES